MIEVSVASDLRVRKGLKLLQGGSDASWECQVGILEQHYLTMQINVSQVTKITVEPLSEE